MRLRALGLIVVMAVGLFCNWPVMRTSLPRRAGQIKHIG